MTIAAALMAAFGIFLLVRGAAGQTAPITSASPQTAAASTQTFPPPLPGGPAPDLGVAFTAQVIGWIEPCG